MTQQRNHRIHSGHRTNTGRITHEDRKRGRFYTRRRWQQAAAALVFILAALFLYRTGQLYLERKALSREAQQWHRVQAGNTPAEPDGGVEYQGKSYRRNTYIKAILCMGIDRPGSLEENRTAGFGGQADQGYHDGNHIDGFKRERTGQLNPASYIGICIWRWKGKELQVHD